MASLTAVLKATSPKADPTFVRLSDQCNAGQIMRDYGLTGFNEQCQLLAHMWVESGGYRAFAENLTYTAERLHAVWPNRFPTVASAQPYARNPKALAVKVYGDRMGNRPGTTDGWDCRGSGGLQHTGRSEFSRVAKRTGVDVLSAPDKLRDVLNAELMWRAACTYFVDRGAVAPARAGDTLTTCKKINGGVNGLADRRTMVARITKIMGSRPLDILVPAVPSPPIAPTDTSSGIDPRVETKVKIDGPLTTTEVVDDESKKTKTATTGTVVAAPGSAGSAKAVGSNWYLSAAIGVAVAIVGALIIYACVRRLTAAKVAVETQQLQGTVTRVENLDA